MSTATPQNEALDSAETSAPAAPSAAATLGLYWRGVLMLVLFGAGFVLMSLGVLEHTANGAREVGLARGWVWALWGFLLVTLGWGMQGLLRARRRGEGAGGVAVEAGWWLLLVVGPLLGHVARALWQRDMRSALVAGVVLGLGALPTARDVARVNHEGVWQWASGALGACGVLLAMGVALPAMPALEHPARGLWVVGWVACAWLASGQLVLWRVVARRELPRRPRQLPALLVGLALVASLLAWSPLP